MKVFINIIAYQVGWFACVLGAVNGHVLLGTLVGAAIVFWHLGRARRPGTELTSILVAGIVGTLWESTLVSAGWITYSHGVLIAGIAPYWITMLWLLFATTFNVSLHWMRRRWLLAAISSAVGAPLAFFAGQKLGALELTVMPDALLAQAAGYAILVPLLLRLAMNFDGYNYEHKPVTVASTTEGDKFNV